MTRTTATRMLCLVTLVACACPSKPSTTGPGIQGSGSATPVSTAKPDAVVTSCDAARPKVEQLYRAEGEKREPKRVPAFVADNTAMVMADCTRNADKVVPCLAAAQSVADIETKCVAALDDEGTEGDAMKIKPH